MTEYPQLFQWTIHALNYSAFFYLAACFSFVFAIATSGSKSEGRWSQAASYFVYVAFILHTFGLLGRWYIGGIGRPPWTNLYESLIFFAWGVSVVQVYAQSKWKMPIVGAFAMPLVFILMGMAVMTTDKDIAPLIPALKSYWLKIHVVFGMISYAGFTVAACLGFMFLMRAGASLSKITAGVALLSILNLGIAGGKDIFYAHNILLNRTVERQDESGRVTRVKDQFMDVDGKVKTRTEAVPYSGFVYWPSMACFLLSSVLLWRRGRQGSIQHESNESVTAEDAYVRGNDIGGLGWRFFQAGIVLLFALFAAILNGIRVHPNLTLQSNPYILTLIIMTGVFLFMYIIITWNYKNFLKSLPSHERLDELSYKNVLFAFPFQTLLLITGAIWAYYAWGRSWGWDPKETWALITWLAYLIYLHAKLLLRWKSTWLAVLAIVGFAIMVFSFLGVNLVLSGLHSYGSA